MSDDVFIWDGRGSMYILAHRDHVHSPEGTCLKNRDGAPCDTKETK